MARPKAKAKAKANAAGSPAAPPVASSRIGLALHRRPQVPPMAPSVASNVAAVASNVVPVASVPNARVVSNAAKSPPQGPPHIEAVNSSPNLPVRINMPSPRPPPPAVAQPLTVGQLLDEARAQVVHRMLPLPLKMQMLSLRLMHLKGPCVAFARTLCLKTRMRTHVRLVDMSSMRSV